MKKGRPAKEVKAEIRLLESFDINARTVVDLFPGILNTKYDDKLSENIHKMFLFYQDLDYLTKKE
jgi:hypothetical protein